MAEGNFKFSLALFGFFVALLLQVDSSGEDLKSFRHLQRLSTAELLKDQHLYNVDAFRELFSDQKYFVPERYFVVPLVYNTETKTASSGSNAVNQELGSILNEIFATSIGSQMLNALKTAQISELKFAFFFSFSGTEVDSWTDSKLQTYVFIGEKGISRERLIRILTHEIAQMTLQDASMKFLNANLGSQNLGKAAIQCSAELVFARPDVAMLFSTLSAFQVENIVLSEINRRAYRAKNTCAQRFFELRRYSPSFLQAIEKTMKSWVRQMPPACSDQDLLDSVQSYFFTESGEELCQQLEKPLIDDRVIRNGTFGPRPNVGNGGGF